MMDKANRKESAMSDNAKVESIGTFIKHHRLEQNKSQRQLAEEAGVSRSTISEIEQGKRSNIITLIQLLRALHLLHVLDQFQIQQQISPIQLAEQEKAKRKRATKMQKKGENPKSDW